MRGIILGLLLLSSPAFGQTIDECRRAAVSNYPLIRHYGLIEKTTSLTVSNLEKQWLPQVSAQAQATYQSDVMSWPEQMQTMLSGLGLELDGLKKDQYKVGVDVQQTVYDGGAIKSRQEIAERQGEVETAQNDAKIYGVHQRVNEMYFGLLLVEEQIRLNRDLQELLGANEKKLAAMLKGGTASESDYLNVKAERLNAAQQLTSLEAQRTTLARLLSAFCGIEVTSPTKPSADAASLPEEGPHPELRAIDAQLRLADAQEKALDAALKPKVGLFAQGYYGYPGYNMFDDMMSHRWSLNGMVGARVSWNIGALYTRKNDKAKIQLQRDAAETSRDVFLFNNNLEQIQLDENISRYRKLMADDEEIISLRSRIRKAAESKLSHGIIDVNDLVKEINGENAARVQRSIHEIQMLKEIYDLKYVGKR